MDLLQEIRCPGSRGAEANELQAHRLLRQVLINVIWIRVDAAIAVAIREFEQQMIGNANRLGASRTRRLSRWGFLRDHWPDQELVILVKPAFDSGDHEA